MGRKWVLEWGGIMGRNRGVEGRKEVESDISESKSAGMGRKMEEWRIMGWKGEEKCGRKGGGEKERKI